jgi:hypothetical protein
LAQKDNFKKTCANSGGLINCLLQPGLFYLSIQKSMREKFNLLIKFCVTRTVPAAETKSIGLQADTRVVMVFATPSGQFHRDTKHSSTYRDFAKTHANPDTDGNSLNRRAVRFHCRQYEKRIICDLDNLP